MNRRIEVHENKICSVNGCSSTVIDRFGFFASPGSAHSLGTPRYGPGQHIPFQAILGKMTSMPGKIPLGGNPYGCVGRSDNPHLSGHAPGNVAAQGHTDCLVSLPYIHVDSTLYRHDCFLFICWWTQVGYDEQTLFGARSVRAIPSYSCNGSSQHLYEIDSYHEVQDSAGTIYYAYTAVQATVACG